MKGELLIVFSLVSTVSSACLPASLVSSHERYFYCQERNLPIVLETSSRVSHQIVTHILQILLMERLGYRDVPILEKSDMNAIAIMDRIAGCHQSSCHHRLMDERVIPETMVNIGVWLPAGFSKSHWTEHKRIVDCGPLGPFGRLGWFMPTDIVKEFWQIGVIADHWRSLMLEDVLLRFSLKKEMDKIMPLTKREGSDEPYCNSPDCENGLFYGPRCNETGVNCATLLSSYPALDQGVLISQVRLLKLPVIIVWIGPHLSPYIQQRTREMLPTLFFDWQTNTLTSSGNFTRLKFPTCATVGTQLPRTCDYDVNQLTKVAWSKIKTRAPEAFHLLSHMSLTQEQYKDIALQYNQNERKKTIPDLACDWVKENHHIWNSWISKDLSNKTNVILGGFFPISGKYLSQPGLVQASKMAIELINKNSSILPQHNLDIIVSDTQCMPDVATKAFIKYITGNYRAKLAGILGPACSDAAEPIAALAKHFNMITVSYEAEAMSLADRTRYPYFFRTIPQISRHRFVYADFFRIMGWAQVGTLSESGQELPEYHILLQDYLSINGIKIPVKRKILRAAQTFDLSQVFADIREKNVRVIICDMFEPAARAVMCEAYRQQMTAYDGYVWFLPAWFSEEWSDVDYFNRRPITGDSQPQEHIPCNTAQMTRAIQGHFVLSKAFYDHDDTKVVGGLTVKQYRQEYEKRVGRENVDSTPFASYVYDAVWTWAFALHKLFQEQPIAIEHLNTKNTTEALMKAMTKTNFQGVTGWISFKGADRVGILTIEQHFLNGTNLVGRYLPDTVSDQGTLYLDEARIVWLTPNGVRPHDGSPGTTSEEPLPDPEQCRVEPLRLLLGVSCESAIIILNVVCLGIFVIITIILLLVLKRRYDNKVKATQDRMKELGLLPSDLSAYLSLDEWELPRDQVVVNRRLGEGAFGTVYGGEAHFEMAGWLAVAVKTLKIGATIEEKLDFLSEAEMMKRFKHPNIVQLLGVCTRGEPAYAIMEFMLHGDLKTYLLSRRNLVGQESKEAEDVTARRLTQMALDIANGMKYLHDFKYVHRDLACRNCLVHGSKTVVIGDFGMTRPMTDADYYRFNRKGILPVRWMSPESLCDGIFTSMSDIWSYGVLVYEIVTFGSFPYQGLSNNQVLEYVKRGSKLIPPANCPELLKDFISQCIEFNPYKRPRAEEIIEILSKEKEFLQPTLDAPSSAVVMECTDSVEIKSSNQNTVTRSSTLNFPINIKRSSSSQERLALLRSNLHVPPHYVRVSQAKSASPRSTITETSTPDRQRRHSIATLLHTPRNSMSPSQSQTQLLPLIGSGSVLATTPRTPPPQAAPPGYQADKGDNSSDYFSDNSKEMCQAITTV